MKPAIPFLFRPCRFSVAVRLAIGGAVLLPYPAQAQKYWTNNLAGAYDLSTATNWEDAAILNNTSTDLRFFRNAANDDLVLSGSFTINNDVTGLALNRLDLDGQSSASGRSVTLSGNSLTLNSGAQLTLGNQANSGGNAFGYTISAPVTVSGNLTVTGSPANTPATGAASFSAVTLPVTAATFTCDSNPRINFNGVSLDADHLFAGTGVGGITFGGTVTLTGNRIFNVTGNSTPALGGTITDGENSYSITKTGSGLLSLAGANHTFDGGVTVQGGTLGLTVATGTVNHSPGGVFVQNGSTVRLDWTGTPTGPVVATTIGFGAGGGSLEFGAATGNPVTLTQSGNVTGSGPLKLVARGNKDPIVFSGDNSAYSGAVSIESATPANLLQVQAVIFSSTAARFGSASPAAIAVRNGGRVGFTTSVTTSDLAPFTLSGNSGIVLAGAAGAFDSAIADPFALIPATGGIVLNNRDSLNNDRWPDSRPVSPESQSLMVVGRNTGGSLTNESVGALSFSGSSRITLDLLNGTNSGVKLTAASLASPSAGDSLLLDVNDSSDQWGTGNGLSHLIVTGTKPAAANGMVSPGIQYYPGVNILGFFMTFDGNDLVKAASTSTDITTAGATDIVNIGSSAQTLNSSKTVHALRLGQNLTITGATLTLGSGGLIIGSNTVSGTGTLDFGSGPGFIGAYNAAAQASITASITGSGGITVLGSSQSLNLNTGTNTFTGGLFINGGNVALSNNAANQNDVTVNAFGRLMAGVFSSVVHNPNIGGLSGSGRVSSWFQGTGSQIFHLTPAASTTHTFDGFFTNGDAGRVLNLVKNGDGTQIISSKAAASHTGTLTVNAGTLLLDADFTSATGLATVGVAGTFGGSGRLGGSATVNAGGKLAFVVTSAPAGHDKLDIAGSLTFEGTSVTLHITSPGGIAAGSYTLATATGGISGTPTFICNMPAGFTGTATVSGTDLVLTVNSTGSTPYDGWADSFPGFTATGPALDPDNDGLENLLEFVLGGDPRASQPGIRPAVTSASGDDLVFSFLRSDESEAQPVTVKVQVSTDLGTWNPSDDITIGAANGSGPNGTTYTVAENGGAPDTVTVTIPKAAATRKFARVVAVE